MWQLVRKYLRRLSFGAAILLIVMAIGVGAFRLVVTQIPSYRGEIQAWARDALGLTINFSRVDARWAWLGPELTFYGASVSLPGESEPVLRADEARIGISVLALIKDRQLGVSRLIVEGTRLAIERDANGSLSLLGASFEQTSSTRFAIEDLPPVEVIVRNSSLVFEDPLQELSWEFLNVGIRLEREADQLRLEARADTPAELGTRIDLSAYGSVIDPADGSGRDWRVVAEMRDLDLSALPTLLPSQTGLPQAGVGDVSVWFDLSGNDVEQATIQFSLSDLQLPENLSFSAAQSTYQNFTATAEWSRSPNGWQLALGNLNLRRLDRSWPSDITFNLDIFEDAQGLAGAELRSGFLRIEDLIPLIATFADAAPVDALLALAPVGDLFSVDINWKAGSGDPEYSASGEFRDIGISTVQEFPGIVGLSGELRADSRSGRLALSTRDAVFDWPEIFRQPLDVDELTGTLIWRLGQEGIRLVSDDLILNNQDMATRSNLELTIPLDGSSPILDLESDFANFDTTRTSHYLPAGALPAPVISWLDRAIISGQVPRAAVEFVGPVAAFPFYEGEGRFWATFDVENGVLDFVENWPEARDIHATVEFLNQGFTATGTGRVFGGTVADITGGIADMHNAVITVDGVTRPPLAAVLDYIKQVPLFARSLGPDLSQLEVGAGSSEVSLGLRLPLTDLAAYELDAEIAMQGGELSVSGFGLSATGINGSLELDEAGVTATGIEGILLDGPVTADVSRPSEPGYRARLDFEGEVAAESVGDALGLPVSAYLAGQTRWQGSLLLPSNSSPDARTQREPLRVSVGSNLSGVALKFPAPFVKVPAEPTNFQVDLVFSQSDRLDVEGNLGAANRFALRLRNSDDGLSFRRGSVRFGGSYPLLPPQDGLDIRGSVSEIHLDEWLDLFDAVALGSNTGTLLSFADLDVVNFSAFGQSLGATKIVVERSPPEWLMDIDSELVAGNLTMPTDFGDREQIVASMQRLHLTAGEGSEDSEAVEIDPRVLPGLVVNADDFSFGARHYGEMHAELQSDPLGLRLLSFDSQSEGFSLSGEGEWLSRADLSTTRLSLVLKTENVAAALDELGLDPLLDGELAEIAANVNWPGGPSADWRKTISGDVSLRIEQGSVLDLEPGAGRMMGLMSITELPRRLALDFRDVFNRGLVFDEVSGTFVLIDGDAYTDNLLLTGPVADIGVVGRTGLKDQTYQQQAVVTAEPGKILPAMGFLAGPGVGTALLIFTQIFKESLKGIGRASYCMSGTWDEPSIERLSPEELSSDELCADLPPGGFTAVQE
jgi:uncharacterized protein (TIGR02099 family)